MYFRDAETWEDAEQAELSAEPHQLVPIPKRKGRVCDGLPPAPAPKM